MTGLYLRWAGIVIGLCAIMLLGIQRYDEQVRPITPEDLVQHQQTDTVRVLGIVQAGSLTTDTLAGRAAFRLTGDKQEVPVHYTGAPTEAIRELKTVVVVGRWSALSGAFEAKEIALTPNAPFILAAYLLTIVPIGLFLFRMERRVQRLYHQIKEARAYTPEEGPGAAA